MALGYWNKISRVDLTNKKITKQEIGNATCKLFLGGAGIGAKILWEEVPPEVSPLDANNRIIFSVCLVQYFTKNNGYLFF